MYFKTSLIFISFLLIVGCEKESFFWNLSKKPVVITNDELVYSSSDISLLVKGSVISDGGSRIIQRGVVWSNRENPTLEDNFTSDGLGIGSFSSKVLDMEPATTYYFRAYAKNSIGTSYGNQIEFSRPAVLVSTNPCNSMNGLSSSYYHWHFSFYDSHPWIVYANGYIGNCYASDDPSIDGYIEFPLTINNSGYLTCWIRSGSSGTWHGMNRMPLITLNGIELATPTVIGGQSEYDWQKIKTSLISNGNHMLRIYFYPRNEIGNGTDILMIDEIEIWEYQ